MSEKPFEFVHYALQLRPHLQNLINDKIYLCLAQPDVTSRIIYNVVGDIMKKLKQMNINDDPEHKDIVVRNLAYGVSAGNADQKNYSNWCKANDKVLSNKEKVKYQIEK